MIIYLDSPAVFVVPMLGWNVWKASLNLSTMTAYRVYQYGHYPKLIVPTWIVRNYNLDYYKIVNIDYSDCTWQGSCEKVVFLGTGSFTNKKNDNILPQHYWKIIYIENGP